MIIFYILIFLLVTTTALAFAKLKPKRVSSNRIRPFNRWTWSIAVLAALASVLFAWPINTYSMDSLWRPAGAAVNASAVWAIVLLGATAIRYFLFREQRA
jgi:hypothetical protein